MSSFYFLFIILFLFGFIIGFLSFGGYFSNWFGWKQIWIPDVHGTHYYFNLLLISVFFGFAVYGLTTFILITLIKPKINNDYIHLR